ncbi:MAG: Fic family protein [Verrucomicrobiae bacterium]|nr:Fic family protein [Verrucomicrobiae bacterium]
MTSDHLTAEKLLGFTWSCPDQLFQFDTPNQERALWRLKKLFPEIVFDVTLLEGNPFTFPQVQTLLDGTTVGGQKISDADQVLNQAASFKKLMTLCKSGNFEMIKKVACELNALAAKGESLQEGIFRNGNVGIAGTQYQPPAADQLDAIFQELCKAQDLLNNSMERGIATFLSCAKNQFFWDGNKRTGRLLMNGILLMAGQDIITVPARCREEFHTNMIRFYQSNDASEMFCFMARQQISQRFS